VVSAGGGVPGEVDRTAIVGQASAPPSDRTQIVIPGQPAPTREDPQQHAAPLAPSQQPLAAQTDLRKLVGWLVSFDLQPTGLDFRLYVGKNKLGRNPKCDIVINKGWISDEHAMILYREGRFMLQDMLSANGTYVNEVLIEDRIYLNDNDSVRLGSTTFKFKAL
jgi:pSer/pThr/pTyr-binding forkhead associated (FHA) protein